MLETERRKRRHREQHDPMLDHECRHIVFVSLFGHRDVPMTWPSCL